MIYFVIVHTKTGKYKDPFLSIVRDEIEPYMLTDDPKKAQETESWYECYKNHPYVGKLSLGNGKFERCPKFHVIPVKIQRV